MSETSDKHDENSTDVIQLNESGNSLSKAVQYFREGVSKTLNYINVGLAPNSLATITAILAISTSEYPPLFWMNTGLSFLNLSVGLHKYKEYQDLKSALEKHGFDERLVKTKSFSWCQRHLSKIAAKELRYEEQLAAFYQREGHKIWHILPKVRGLRRHLLKEGK